MKKLYDDIWQTTLEHPFAGLSTHAYLLVRDEGNVLFYNTSIFEDIDGFADLGGIDIQFLSHRHESGKSLSIISKKYESKLCASELESPYIDADIDIIVSDRQIHSFNIEIIPTPGHTDGGLCFYYHSPLGRNYLFTGDTLYRSHQEWKTLVFSSDGGSADSLIKSLETLRSLKPDVVICSAYVGETAVMEMYVTQWHKIIDSNISQLTRRV